MCRLYSDPFSFKELQLTVKFMSNLNLSKPTKISVFSFFLLGLGACQPLVLQTASIDTGGGIGRQGAPETITPAQKQPPASATGEGAATDTPLETAAIVAIAPPEPKPPEIPKVSDINPQLFLGKPLQDITNILGEADFVRIEGQIGIWQYRQPNCVVDFFFRATETDASQAEQTATALDVRHRILGQALNEKNCHTELYERSL